MAFPVVNLPVRSISLPSRQHPCSVKIESVLNHLRISTIVLCSGSETIQISLVGLAELYNCVEELIHSPQTQQALLGYQGGRLVEEALDGSITLLDACSTLRDMLSNLKEQVQMLQSALRRGSSKRSSISAYISFRKKAKKEIAYSIATLKKMETKGGLVASSCPVLDQDQHLVNLIRILREARAITIAILRSLLLFMSMPSTKTTGSGWSLITKLVPLRSKLWSEKAKNIVNEVGCVDVALHSLHESLLQKDRAVKVEEVEMAQKMLEALSVGIEGLEAGLDCNFRCLVKNRVSFLNILTQ